MVLYLQSDLCIIILALHWDLTHYDGKPETIATHELKKWGLNYLSLIVKSTTMAIEDNCTSNCPHVQNC